MGMMLLSNRLLLLLLLVETASVVVVVAGTEAESTTTLTAREDFRVTGVSIPCTTFLCFLNSAFILNLSGQLLHSKWPPSVCTNWCFFRFPSTRKDFSHWEQLKGFSPEWILKWAFRLFCWLKPLWQKTHSKGRSPVCTRMWICKKWLEMLNIIRKNIIQRFYL